MVLVSLISSFLTNKTSLANKCMSFSSSNLALWSNLQTCKHFLVQKEFECTKCKATFKFFFQRLWVFVMPFCFQALIKGEKVSISWVFLTFYCLKQPTDQNRYFDNHTISKLNS